MRVQQLAIRNYRGVATGTVDFSGHTLLVGGNNIGKSTVCEALDLVLGPERLGRRPIVDEHDFHRGQYLGSGGKPVEIEIRAVLTGLSAEAEKQFFRHLRRWNEDQRSFADEGTAGPGAGDAPGIVWALPVLFIGRYDSEEDDFVGNTFFDHPLEKLDEDDEEPEVRLGGGRKKFTREHKRLCGFLFLRALRTGSRALSLQRGSLLDTVLRLPGSGFAEMWQDTLRRLRELSPGIGEIDQLQKVSKEIRERMAQFVNLAPGDDATAFFASDLTREHLREVVRLFVSAEPNAYLLPFQRLGTGSVNLLVFALLTFIAELKDRQSVIFAMEEPEIALPPHTQRRVTRFVLSQMGQAIVTSHSPYVIEQFQPKQIVVLARADQGKLSGIPIDVQGIKSKVFTRERRQFAEAILANAVLVVEGATEAAIFPAASSVLERDLGSGAYSHFDIAGVTVFDAGGDGSTPQYGPCFAALGKRAFCLFDRPTSPLSADATAKLASYTQVWESDEKGIESLLVKELSEEVLRRFLNAVKDRPDFPKVGTATDALTPTEVQNLTKKVLEARKGNNYGYGSLLIDQCNGGDELPATIREILLTIHKCLTPPQAPKPAAETVQPQPETLAGGAEASV